MALIFGLRARTQALSGRQALAEGDLTLAQQAMIDVYATINRGRRRSRGFRSAEARPRPTRSSRPWATPPTTRSGRRLSWTQFIAALAPLLDEAEAMTGTTTAT